MVAAESADALNGQPVATAVQFGKSILIATRSL